MTIKEQTHSMMVVTRGCLIDRLFFSFFIALGLGLFFFADRIGAPVWFGLALGALLIAGGAYFWWLSAHVTLTLDRNAGVAKVEWAHVHCTTSRAAPLAEVLRLGVDEDGDADRLSLRLKDGSTMPLAPYKYTGGDHPGIRKAVNAWLQGRA
ncbi:MAG: hypothetical protein AAFN79_09870 [Pseudomonadota bacterium]